MVLLLLPVRAATGPGSPAGDGGLEITPAEVLERTPLPAVEDVLSEGAGFGEVLLDCDVERRKRGFFIAFASLRELDNRLSSFGGAKLRRDIDVEATDGE